MKRLLILAGFGILLMLCTSTQAIAFQGIKSDQELRKDPSYWRSKAPYLPSFRWRLGIGFRPNYFAPANAEVDPYVSSSLSLSTGWALAQAGVKGYWSDLGFGLSWGFSKALTTNSGGSNIARRIYARDFGFGMGKTIYREKNTGISLSGSLSLKIPFSLSSRQRTLITSLGTGLSLSKRFFNAFSLSYSFGANFNFYQQDSTLYNPAYAGLPGMNSRWGMSHSLGFGFSPIKNFSVRAGLNIGVGYTFADAYPAPDGPQVFGGENLGAADLASYSINEGNYYGISIGVGYRFNRFLSLNAGYSNGGAQYIYQYDTHGNRRWVLRNPFRLQNGSFGFGISGSI